MKIHNYLWLGIILTLTIYSYIGCVENGFVYDDHAFVEKNPSIRSLKNIPRFFLDPIHTTASEGWKGIYRPLRALSYALDYKLYKLNPGGYHLTNLILHLVNVILAFIFLNLLLNDKRIATLSTFLFALHPVQTEPVLWIGSRADLLLGLFEFLTLIFFIKFLRTESKKHYYYALLGLVLALLSKETAIVTPILFIVMMIAFNKNMDNKIILPPFLITLIYLPIRIYLMQGLAQRGWWGGNFINNFLTAIKLVSHYVYLLIYPYHLSVDYGFKPVRSLWDPLLLLGILILIILLILGLKCKKTNKHSCWLGIIWFILFLIPSLNIIPLTTITGDRFLYLSSLGVFLLISEIIFYSASKKSTVLKFMLIAILLITYIPTIKRRTREWRNDYTLFSAVLKYNPNSWMSYQNLGVWYHQRKDYKNAERCFQEAERVRKDHPLTYKSLGIIYMETGLVEKAQQYFLKAILLNPQDADGGNLLAITFDIEKKYDIAEKLYTLYLEIDPHNEDIKRNLRSLYSRLEKTKKNFSRTEQPLR